MTDSDYEYVTAKCTDVEYKKYHQDGSGCMPEWDGIMFVCFNRILGERNEREEKTKNVG